MKFFSHFGNNVRLPPARTVVVCKAHLGELSVTSTANFLLFVESIDFFLSLDFVLRFSPFSYIAKPLAKHPDNKVQRYDAPRTGARDLLQINSRPVATRQQQSQLIREAIPPAALQLQSYSDMTKVRIPCDTHRVFAGRLREFRATCSIPCGWSLL